MKITLDIDQLLSEGAITQTEYEKFSELAVESTSTLAFNKLIEFGVIAVSGAAIALVPTLGTAILIGLLILSAGLMLLRSEHKQWKVLSNICILVGALMAGIGVIIEFFAIQKPTITIILFSLLATGLYQLSKRLSNVYEKIALASARTGVFLVNLGFWIGSLWGERLDSGEVIISDSTFAIIWAVALIATAIWAWKNNLRWVLNTVAIFGGIHFYTQWFEHLGSSPTTVLIAGLLALAFAIGIRGINNKMKEND